MRNELLPWRNRTKIALGKLKAAGDAAQRRHAWSESVPLYQQYLALRGEDAAIWVQLGHALKESGDLAGAEAAYRQALLVAPDDDDSRLHLVALLRRIGNKSEADLLERSGEARAAVSPMGAESGGAVRLAPAARVRPVAKVTDRARGDAARDAGDWPRAVAFYADHLISNMGDSAIWVQLGHALKEQSLFDDALYAYAMARHLDGRNIDTIEHLSRLLARMGRSSGPLPLWAALFETGNPQPEPARVKRRLFGVL